MSKEKVRENIYMLEPPANFILAQLTQQKDLRDMVASLSVHEFKFNRLWDRRFCG